MTFYKLWNRIVSSDGLSLANATANTYILLPTYCFVEYDVSLVRFMMSYSFIHPQPNTDPGTLCLLTRLYYSHVGTLEFS